MRRRGLFIVAIFLLFTITSVTFAFWDTLSQSSNGTVIIGEGTEVVITVNLSEHDGKSLIPQTAVLGINDVHAYVLTYNVKLSKQTSTDLDLIVVANNKLIGESNTYADLVNVNIVKAADVINTSDVLITVTVTLTEPADEAAYLAVKNKSITFNLVFTAIQPAA